MPKTLSENQIQSYLELLNKYGESGLFKRVIGAGVIRFTDNKHVELELLDMSESFFAAFRRIGDDKLFVIGKILRRAAHVLYRKLQNEANSRFLTLIRDENDGN